MKIELSTPTLALPRDGLIALRDAEGTRVTTLKGALWITQDSQQGDVILEEGQSFTVDRRGLNCFAESGNSYKAALMLASTGCDWEPVRVDYFGGETRGETFRSEVGLTQVTCRLPPGKEEKL